MNEISYDIFMDRETRIQMAHQLAQGVNSGEYTGLPNLKRLRIQKFRSQKALCRHCGFDRTTYNSWEIGRHWPSAKNLPILADALGCTIDDLFRPAGESEGTK